MNEERKRLAYTVMLLKSQGFSLRQIVALTGKTKYLVTKIYNQEKKRRESGETILEREDLVPPRLRASRLDPYEDKIHGWLQEFPKITSQRILEKLKDAGLDIGYTMVRLRVDKLRKELAPKIKTPFVEVVTAPGKQCQFDWSEYRLDTGLKIQVWSCTLSWSRGRFFEVTDNQKQSTILRLLQETFQTWGGVPRQAVTDSMPGIVDRWELGKPILNLRFVDFATYYDLAIDIAPRGQGNYKGKVERPFHFFELNFLGGRKFHSMAQAKELLEWWVREKAMTRPHPDTKRPLWEMLQEERPYLRPLPAHPYDTRDVVFRDVDRYGYVFFETNRYRVPDECFGQILYVVVGHDKLEIFDHLLNRVAEYARLPDGAGRKAGEPRKAKGRYNIKLLSGQLAEWGESAEQFANQLLRHKRAAGPQLLHLLNLQLRWASDDILAAISHALDYQAFDANAVERILTARYTPRRLDQLIADSTRNQVRRLMQEYPVEQRKLDEYTTLDEGD